MSDPQEAATPPSAAVETLRKIRAYVVANKGGRPYDQFDGPDLLAGYVSAAEIEKILNEGSSW